MCVFTDPGTFSAGSTGVVADLEVVSPDQIRRTRSVVEYSATAADVSVVAVTADARLVVTIGHLTTATHAAVSSAPARTVTMMMMTMMMMMATDIIHTIVRVVTSRCR